MKPLTYWQKREVFEHLCRSKYFHALADMKVADFLRELALISIDDLLKALT